MLSSTYNLQCVRKLVHGFFFTFACISPNSKQPPSPAMFACCFSGREYEDDTQHEAARPQANRPPSDEMSLAPKPVTGRRKPSDAAQKLPPQSVTTYSDHHNREVQPRDYLWFGEGSSGHRPRYTAANSTNQQGASKAGSGNPSGRDNSGYLATGLNNNSQMGYSNLTYGGSLQYNFAGTQPIGVGT